MKKHHITTERGRDYVLFAACWTELAVVLYGFGFGWGIFTTVLTALASSGVAAIVTAATLAVISE